MDTPANTAPTGGLTPHIAIPDKRGGEAIDFRAGGKPGKAVTRRSSYFGDAEVSEILIRVDHDGQPQTILFRSALDIPEPQQ